jgi:NADPH-dependent 2,4-dienoyl-CoA reductase/sulfur reductase-like enzyme/rhodanese-related sulfurtransferase
MKIIIVGGVAGGMSAAARLRRLSEEAEIIVFEKGEQISFANCGLPYYIGGVIKKRAALIIQTPAAFRRRFQVDVRIGNEVLSLHRAAKKVKVKDLASERIYEESYDKLILAPGAEPLRPPLPGIDHANIFTLRTLDDTFKIRDFLDSHKPQTALVVGGGPIGLEMAENLAEAGLRITLAEALPQVMNTADVEIAALIHKNLRERGIALCLSDGVKSFADESGKVVTLLASGREIVTDFVIFAVGVRPETKLAAEAGLAVGRGISVNEFLQTSDEDIYAIGDAIEFMNPLTGKKYVAALAGPANKQGRMAADNIIEGNNKKYYGTLGTAVVKIFAVTVAVTGLAAKVLDVEQMPYESVVIHPGSHAGYYPGATAITLKLLFSPTDGKILGAQAAGFEGVDRSIDVISAYISKQGTVYDLTSYEHCYAPPFSSAKDAVNMAGFVAENVLSGKLKTINWDKVASLGDAVYLLDVRTVEECRRGMAGGAVNIPLDDLRARLGEVPQDRKIAVYCAVGIRSYAAARILMQKGYGQVYNLSGGFMTYSSLQDK